MAKRIVWAIVCLTTLAILSGCGSAPKTADLERHSGPTTFEGDRSILQGPGSGAIIKTQVVLSVNDNAVTGFSDAPFTGTYRKDGSYYKIVVNGVIEKKQLRFKLTIKGTIEGSVLKGTFSQSFDDVRQNQNGTIELVAK